MVYKKLILKLSFSCVLSKIFHLSISGPDETNNDSDKNLEFMSDDFLKSSNLEPVDLKDASSPTFSLSKRHIPLDDFYNREPNVATERPMDDVKSEPLINVARFR